MVTDLQKRTEQLAAILRVCGLEGEEHRVLRQQLDSFSNLQIEVAHRLVMRADNGLAQYWQNRCESAERFITGEEVHQVG